MNKYLVIATVIFALAGFCLANFGCPLWKADPKVKPIIDAICNVSKRPDQTQWTNLLNCSCDNKTADPTREKYVEMMKGVFANCSKVADDIPAALKTTNEDQMKVIYLLCSPKYEDCKLNAFKQIQEQMKNDKPNDKPNEEERKQKNDVFTGCLNKALGLP